MARYNRELIASPEFRPGRRVRVELRAQELVRAYIMRMLYDLVVTGGTGKGDIYSDAHHRMLAELQFRANGTDIMVVSGQFLRAYNLFLSDREELEQTQPTGLDAGTQAGLEANWYLPLFGIGSKFYEDEFAAPTRLLDAPELIIRWGTVDDIVEGADGIIEIANPMVELFEEFHDRPAPDAFVRAQGLRAQQYHQEIHQSGPAKVTLQDLGAGDEVRLIVVEAFSGGDGGQHYKYSNGLVQDVRAVVGGKGVQETIPFNLLRNLNRATYMLNSAFDGLVMMNPAEDGNLGAGELWTVTGRTKPTVELSVNKEAGDCMVRVTVVYVSGRLAHTSG